MRTKVWCKLVIVFIIGLLVTVAAFNAIIDPFFHYHKPLTALEYPIDNQRYQNYGIVKNFEYDAIITGTSMTENFKASEVEALFSTTAIKVPFAGGSFKEINDLLCKAFTSGNEIKVIIRGLDGGKLLDDKDAMQYDKNMYPWYLYDETAFNDVEYLLNKDVLFSNSMDVLIHTLKQRKTTTFDEYSYWNDDFSFGKGAVDKTYERPLSSEKVLSFSEEDYERLKGNIEQNVIQLTKEHPTTEFYLFIPPYSIYWWDRCMQNGSFHHKIETFRLMSEMLVGYDNVHLYSFFDEYEIITNLDYYKDVIHYSEDINSKILQWMANDTHKITEDNYEAYWDEIEKFYGNYNYDALFQE